MIKEERREAVRCSVDEIGELFPQLDDGGIIEIK